MYNPKQLAAPLLFCLTGCAESPLPTQPSMAVLAQPTAVLLDAEPGSGDGHIFERTNAVSGQTLHLAPGERRQWTFEVRGGESRYLLSVTYSNSRGGPNELLSLEIDGVGLGSFEARDTGEGAEGWNLFVTDPVGVSTLGPGRHTLSIHSSGGDGCVEIDLVSVRPM